MSIYTYGSVLALSLGAAWYQWSKPPSVTEGDEVVILYGEEKSLEEIIWESDKDKAVIEFRSDAVGNYLWATYTDKKKEEEQEKSFKVGQDGEKLCADLSPLVAIRALENVSEEKKEEIGLKTPTTSLSIKRKGKTTVFDVGNEAYGTKDLYIQNRETKEVFLLDDAKVRTLKFARTRLPDRQLWSFEKEKITKITLQASLEGQPKTLVLLNKNWQDKLQAKWVRQDDETADNTQLTNWITKYLRSTNSAYTNDIDVSTLSKAFDIEMEGDGAPKENISVYYDAEKQNWYAQTTHSRGVVKLIKQSISGLYEDLPALFAAPQETSSEETKESIPNEDVQK